MRAGRWSSLIAGGLAALSGLAAQQAAAAPNPLGFFYENSDAEPSDTFDDAYRFVGDYKHPTAMLVTGRCNRYDPHFTEARARGAEVLAYLNPVEVTNSSPCPVDNDFYRAEGEPARWLDPGGNVRSEFPNAEMLDIRVNSAWIDRVVAYVEDLMVNNQVDGVFLDVVGARLWSDLANWGNDPTKPLPTWTQAERDAWTAGNVDLVRRLFELRNQINPRFIIVNNNTWTGPLTTAAAEGEKYVDGVCLEHHAVTESMGPYAGRPFGRGPAGTGVERHRRVLIIANDDSIAADWAQVTGVTHIASQHGRDDEHPLEGYGSPSRPSIIPLSPLFDRQKLFGRVSAASVPSLGMTADQKRASRFTLSEQGRLHELSAYLDGNGGASGQQAIKLVLYRDSGGAPGAKLAESNARNFSSGMSAGWYSFSLTSANQVLLTPGDYWIGLFTGGTTQVLRNFGDGAANWYGNADTYADGASNPFGTGNAGTVTLSVRAGYTPE